VTITEHRVALNPIVQNFRDNGIYAYGTVDDENRWCVAADLDLGHIDVRIGLDGYELDVWATSPGMFLEEENERRRKAMERLVRVSIPGIQRGFLDDHHLLTWDDFEQGIALRKSVALPFSVNQKLPEIAMAQLEELNDTLEYLESRLIR
jgi:hypothetical protein